MFIEFQMSDNRANKHVVLLCEWAIIGWTPTCLAEQRVRIESSQILILPHSDKITTV